MVIETVAQEKAKSPLRHLHDTQVTLEKFRIQLGNRVSALQRGVDEAENPVPSVYVNLTEMALTMEHEIDKAIAEEVQRWPVYNAWLRHVRGIGPSLSGQMLAMLLTPLPDKGPSSWYKAAGLVPEMRPDGLYRLPRARAGEGKITYHPWLRRCLYNVSTSFVKMGNYYRAVYDEEKAALATKHQGDAIWPPIRIDRAARWAMIKLFLSHLWETWCEADGIHNRGPYGLVTLPDGTKVIRVTLPGGATQDHAYRPAPRPNGGEKI